MPYIGTSPSNGVRRVHTYTATASQTTFTGASNEGITLSYADTNYLDVFQNGVLLGSADYTSTSGTSVVLAQGASADDLIVIVVYDVFSVADTVSKTNGGSFDNGITINEDGATVLTVDRATSDGSIIDLQKDGTSIGNIGVANTDQLSIGTPDGSEMGLRFDGDLEHILPANASGAKKDASADLGSSTARWQNLYLSGGAYIGGTGSANLLDDYEEGTWTPSLDGSTGNPTATASATNAGFYTKVGRMVMASFRVEYTSVSGGSGTFRIAGLPFNVISNSNYRSSGNVSFFRGVTHYGNRLAPHCIQNNNLFQFYKNANATEFDSAIIISDLSSSVTMHGHVMYMTS